MTDISTDLLFLVFFALVFLYQYVMQRIRASRKPQDAPAQLPQATQEQALGTQWEWVVPDAAPAAEPAIPAPVAAARRTEHREPTAMRDRHRFSRDALLGDRHRLQDAVVIAAIVGPCRAMEPHEIRQ